MNRLSIAISARKTQPNEVPNFSRAHVAIDLTVSIDGVALGDTSDEIDNGVILDGYALLATMRSNWRQYFFTCGCGEAGCAGIFQGVLVACNESVVEWIFPEDYHSLLKSRGFAVTDFTFDRTAYLAQMQRVVKFVRRAETWTKLPACIGSSFHYSNDAFPHIISR
jgi:hypothetical protein